MSKLPRVGLESESDDKNDQAWLYFMKKATHTLFACFVVSTKSTRVDEGRKG